MKPDYKNRVPTGMIYGLGAAAAGFAGAACVVRNKPISAVLSAGALGCCASKLERMYSQVTVNTVGSMGCFSCVKGEQ